MNSPTDSIMTDTLQFLLGRTLRLGETRYRLDKELGSGATAVVFLGVLADAPDDASGHVAVKVARPDSKSAESLQSEWHNLTRLAQAAHPQYFPNIPYPNKVEDLTQELFAGGEFIKVSILVQELVQGQGIAEIAAKNKNLSLPEPLALEVARQYAEMLQTAHECNITSFDRKIGDLRWSAKGLANGNHSSARWERETAGSLKVLDWNVTHEASPGNIQLDLFRFGLLWHKLLLGTEPRFNAENAENWQLTEPLSRQVGWAELTWGTRRILERLLAATKAQYRDAGDLIKDILAEIGLWQQDQVELEKGYRAIYDRNRGRETPTFSAVDHALRAADVHRHRRDLWRDLAPSDLDNIIRALSTAWSEGLLAGLRSSLLDSNWTTVRSNLADIKTRPLDIVTQLHLDRIEQIVEFAFEKSLKRHDRSLVELFQQEDAIQKYVIDATTGDLTSEKIDEWRKLAEACADATEKSVRTRLWMGADYHYRFVTARSDEAAGRYLDASEHYDQIVNLRKNLKSLRKNTVNLLDRLYGDPSRDVDRLRELTAKTKADSDIVDLLRQGLDVIGVNAGNDDQISPKELSAHVAVAARQHPDCEPLIELYRLLTAEATRRLHSDSASLLAMQVLAAEQEQWRALAEKADAQKDIKQGGAPKPSNLDEKLWDVAKSETLSVKNRLNERQIGLRVAVLNAIGVEPINTEKKGETSIALSEQDFSDQDAMYVQMLVSSYRQTFPHDEDFSTTLSNHLEMIKKKVAVWHGDLKLSQFYFDQDKANRALLWARRGELVSDALGQVWDNTLSEKTLQEEFGKYNRTVNERNYRKGCLLWPFSSKATVPSAQEESQ